MLSSNHIPRWLILGFMMLLIGACQKDDPDPFQDFMPAVTFLSSYSGKVGDNVLIFGKNFGPDGAVGTDTIASYCTVDFNGVRATIQKIGQRENGEQLIFTSVPTGASSGKITVASTVNESKTVFETDFIVAEPVLEANLVMDLVYPGHPIYEDSYQAVIYDINIVTEDNYYALLSTFSGFYPHHIFRITPTSVDTIVFNLNQTGRAFHYGLAMDKLGNIYVPIGHTICKISPNGILDTIAGSTKGFEEGPGEAAKFDDPMDVGIDQEGNLYVADAGNNRVRKISHDGMVTTFAGGTVGDSDGWGTSAQFYGPMAIFVDKNNLIWLTEFNGTRVRTITPEGLVSTYAGSLHGYYDASQKEHAHFQGLWGIAVDDNGSVYVADNGNKAIRKISTSGQVTTLMQDICAFGLTIDTDGNLLAACSEIHKIVLN